MAKKYTRAQWEKMQSRFPQEDRTPYEMSPDKDMTEDVGFRQAAKKAKQLEATRADRLNNLQDVGFEQAAKRATDIKPAGSMGSTEPVGGGTGPTGGTGAGTGSGGAGDGAGAGEGGGTGAGGGTEDDGLTPYERFLKAQQESQRQDAFQAIVAAFTSYGIEGLADTVFALMSDPNIGDQQAIYKLKYDTSINPATNKPWNEAYTKRFPANTERIKAGKPALSEDEYLTAERSYARAFRSLGVPGLATKQNFNKLIVGDVSADEAVDRVNTVMERIQNAPKETKDALAAFYPNISIGNIAEAVLDPEVSLPALRRQILAAEIGGGALRAGLGLTRQRAEELGGYGITEQQAQVGFQQIAGILERGGQLAAIYKTPYDQKTAEQEVFNLAGGTEAARVRQKLIRTEEASFSGSAGTTQGALSRERAGQF